MTQLIIYTSAFLLLIIGIAIYLTKKRNYFNKHKYVRVEMYTSDKTVNVSYHKKENFNVDNAIKINPDHVFNFYGYQSIMISSESAETINPLDFKSQFKAEDFRSAMHSKLIHDTFNSLRVEKFDKVMLLLMLSTIELVAIVYLIYIIMGAK